MNKKLALLAMAVGLGFGSQAYAVPFTVNEAAVGGGANMVTADRIQFAYQADFNQIIAGGDSFAGSGDTFTETGRVSVSGLSLNNVNASTFLNSPEPSGYKLFANFTAGGEANFFNGTDISQGVRVLFDSFDLSLYADTNSDGVDDTLLGTATFAGGEAHVFGGLANGDFDILALFQTTAAGDAYFVDPNPFYINFEFNGVNTAITGLDPVNGGAGTIDGSGNAFFQAVPEPATLGLLGISLIGLAAARRRKANQA
jgi:hypothetical protein